MTIIFCNSNVGHYKVNEHFHMKNEERVTCGTIVGANVYIWLGASFKFFGFIVYGVKMKRGKNLSVIIKYYPWM